MNAKTEWLLAVVALILGYSVYGWQGAVLALTVTAFWLLLQFSRTLRVLRMAGRAPVGHVANAVMLHAQMRAGMRLPQVIALTGSLGRQMKGEEPETWAWRDGQGDEVAVKFANGRCVDWHLRRAQT